MPGQTPILGLPYPEGTDPVMDGDDVIQSLAERVETVLRGTDWATAVTNGGWANHESAPCEYRTDGAGNVHLRGVAVYTSGGPDVFTLPDGFRPSRPQVFIGSTGTVGSVGTIEVSPAGVVTCNMQVSLGGATTFHIDCCFSTH